MRQVQKVIIYSVINYAKFAFDQGSGYPLPMVMCEAVESISSVNIDLSLIDEGNLNEF